MLPTGLMEESILTALRQVLDPELGINVVDLGLVYGVAVEGSSVHVTMTLTTPGCPLHASLTEAVRAAIELTVPDAWRVVVDLVWDPRWSPDRMSETGRRSLGWT